MGKKKKDEKKVTEEQVVEEVRDLFDKKQLEERCARFEVENNDLRINNQLLSQQYYNQRERQTTICKELQQTIDENTKKIEELHERNAELQTVMEDEQISLREEMSDKDIEHQIKLAEANEKIKDLSTKFEAVTDFVKRQKEVTEELDMLRNNITKLEDKHFQELSDQDRKKAIEIDTIKNEMQIKIEEVKESMRRQAHDEMDSNSKRMLQENEQMTLELQFQGKEMEKLLGKNKILVNEMVELKRNLGIQKEMEQELARRTHTYQKLIKKLHDKLQAMEQNVVQPKDLLQSVDTPSNVTKSISPEPSSQQILELEHQLDRISAEYQEYKLDHQTSHSLQEEAIRIVVAALYDLKNSGGINKKKELNTRQREAFLDTLMYKLKKSLCIQCSPDDGGNYLCKEHLKKSFFKLPTKLPKIGKLKSLSEAEESLDLDRLPKGCQTGPDDSLWHESQDLTKVTGSMWEWSSYMDESINKVAVVRGPVRDWGRKFKNGSRPT